MCEIPRCKAWYILPTPISSFPSFHVPNARVGISVPIGHQKDLAIVGDIKIAMEPREMRPGPEEGEIRKLATIAIR